tara:strand:- start:3034 stop:5430 length:2397 start_codon:yes stop_codon:yes gene_type:complete
MIKEIAYKGKYLPDTVVSECFEDSSYNYVDKQHTGNGFTTGFLNLQPTHDFQSNIIIVPNREVIKSKKKSYDNATYNKTSIGFFYGDESSDRLAFGKFDVMMFVVDSFLNYLPEIKKNIDSVDKILIDEAHSILIQSSFRNRLVGFTELVRDEFKGKSIVSVTATPMLFTEVTIKLVKDVIEQRTIHISKNTGNTLKRLQESLKQGNNCIIATQDARILKKLTDNKNKLTANIKVGITLFQKIVETVNLTVSEDAKLTIISSAGFEGFDVDNGVNDVFIFEDRAFDYQTFYPQNITQIIGRSRKGNARIEWCRIPNSDRTEMLSKEVMIKKAESKRISFEKKMTDKNYKFIPKYFDYNQDVDFGLITDLKLNDVKYDLAKELQDADIKGLSIYNQFFTERGFTLDYLNDGSNRLNLKGSTHQIAFNTAKLNVDVINKYNLFSDITVNLYAKENHADYIKAYEVYLRRKYWYADTLLWMMSNEELYNFNTHCLDIHLNEIQGYRIILDEDNIDEYLKGILKISIQNKKKVLYRKSKEFKQWQEDLIYNLKDRYTRLVMSVAQNKIKLPSKERNSRDYNLLTEVSIDLIHLVADAFEKKMVEVDIVSCNPRIIYAYCGLKLPADFYGKDKVNKKAINKLLNTISIDFPKQFLVDIERYKKNRNKDLIKLGFDKKVIEFLFTEFWNREKDALFNFCAYHEKMIIEKLQTELINLSDYGSYIRRHDSVISFRLLNDSQVSSINNFEYLGEGDWFKEMNELSVPVVYEKGIENRQLVKSGEFEYHLNPMVVRDYPKVLELVYR